MNFSFWEQRHFFNYDFIVVGGGIVGLSTAWYLKQQMPDKSVLILERSFPPSGASTKNAGFACFGSISELIEQEKKLGYEGLQTLIEKRWKGLLRLRNLLGDEAIDYQQNGGFELFTEEQTDLKKASFDQITHFNQMAYPIFNKQDVYQPASTDIDKFGFQRVTGLIKNKLEGQIDTGKMMFSLMQKVSSAGVLLVPDCVVSGIELTNHEIHLSTSLGGFKCGKLLLATNAFTNDLIPHQDIYPGRGQVLVTRPIPGLKIRGTFHYDQGFYYFRNFEDRILFGGGRNLNFDTENTEDFGLTQDIQNRLEQLLREVILPDVNFTIETRWSGIMAFGKDLNPIIRELQPDVFCAVRSNGMGVALGTENGFELAQMALGEK